MGQSVDSVLHTQGGEEIVCDLGILGIRAAAPHAGMKTEIEVKFSHFHFCASHHSFTN